MKEHLILFSGEMVRAINEGRKTQTRRVIKLQPKNEHYKVSTFRMSRTAVDYVVLKNGEKAQPGSPAHLMECPYGQPGDRLIVKEASWIWCEKIPNGTTKTGRKKWRYNPVDKHVVYCADNPKPTERIDDNTNHLWRFKTARFMPRWASRTTSEIDEIRVERLQDITGQDVLTEGTPFDKDILETPCNIEGAGETYLKGCFMRLWDSINSQRGYSWDKNPWVWVIKFHVLEVKNETRAA